MSGRSTRAIFLDRDGTLLVEAGYVTHPSLVAPYRFAFEALRIARQSGFLLIVVTNQSGIARGWLSESDLELIHRRMRGLFEAEGVHVDAIYYCPHHPDGNVKTFRSRCTCRKPGIALGKKAIGRFGIDPARSFMIGDKETDVLFGKSLGASPCLVRTGFGSSEESRIARDRAVDFPVFDDVLHAINWAISKERDD